jgi:hypothetical protein
MVTNSKSINLRDNKEIKYKFDESSKAYLTRSPGMSNHYVSQNRVYHGKALSVDKSHIDIDKGVHKVMKTTTYQIGKLGGPNEKTSSHQTQFDVKKNDEVMDRRSDPSNPNRVMTFGFGFGAEKGTQEH